MHWTNGDRCLCRKLVGVRAAMPETKSCESYRINKLGTTNDTLTSRWFGVLCEIRGRGGSAGATACEVRGDQEKRERREHWKPVSAGGAVFLLRWHEPTRELLRRAEEGHW